MIEVDPEVLKDLLGVDDDATLSHILECVEDGGSCCIGPDGLDLCLTGRDIQFPPVYGPITEEQHKWKKMINSVFEPMIQEQLTSIRRFEHFSRRSDG